MYEQGQLPFSNHCYPPRYGGQPAFQPILIPESCLPTLKPLPNLTALPSPFSEQSSQPLKISLPKRRKIVETVDLSSEEESPFLTEKLQERPCQLCLKFVRADLVAKFNNHLEMERHAQIHSEQTARPLEDCFRLCFGQPISEQQVKSTKKVIEAEPKIMKAPNSSKSDTGSQEEEPVPPNKNNQKQETAKIYEKLKERPSDKSMVIETREDQQNEGEKKKSGSKKIGVKRMARKSKEEKKPASSDTKEPEESKGPSSSTPIPSTKPVQENFMDEIELPSYGDFKKNLCGSENAPRNEKKKPAVKPEKYTLVTIPVLKSSKDVGLASKKYQDILKEILEGHTIKCKKCRVPKRSLMTGHDLEIHVTFHFSIATIFCSKCSREMKPSEAAAHEITHKRFLECLRKKNEDKLVSALDSCFGPIKSPLTTREPTPPRFDSSLKPPHDGSEVTVPASPTHIGKAKKTATGGDNDYESIISVIRKKFPVKCGITDCPRKEMRKMFVVLSHLKNHFPSLKAYECQECSEILPYQRYPAHKKLHKNKANVLVDIRYKQAGLWIKALKSCYM